MIRLRSEFMTILLMPRFLGLLPLAALSPASWYYLGLLFLVLLLVGSSYWAYRAWSDIHEEEAAATADELMEAFEEARAAGELDEEEYARVRERIRESGSAHPPTGRGKPVK